MLVKSLGIFKIVYTASMLSVPEMVVKTGQVKIFKFLWKKQRDKVKRAVIYQPFSCSPNDHNVVRSLCLSRLGRF